VGGRQERLFAVQDRRIQIVGVVGLARRSRAKIRGDGLAQHGVGDVEEVRVSEERNLQVVRAELQDVELRPDRVRRHQPGDESVEFGAERGARVPKKVQSSRQPFAVGRGGEPSLVLGQGHRAAV
jgi:hypothetical protein